MDKSNVDAIIGAVCDKARELNEERGCSMQEIYYACECVCRSIDALTKPADE